VDKGDPPATGAEPRRFVDQPIPGGATSGESGIEIGDSVADVMDSWSPPGQKTGDWAFGGSRRQQFHFGLAEREADDGGAVSGFGWVRLEGQHVTIEGDRRVEVLDSDADMGNAGTIGHDLSLIESDGSMGANSNGE
jgi:hypothetical protein